MSTTGTDPDAWPSLLAHREQLLRLAMSRAPTKEAAEDAVHEALTRAAQHWDSIDAARLGAWLTSVTARICIDQHRELALERRHLPRLVEPSGPSDPAVIVADRDEARWVSEQLQQLPRGQRAALHALSEEGSIPATAERLGLSRQAAEGLVKRARAGVRARFASTLAAALAWASRRRAACRHVGLAAASVALVIIGLSITNPFGWSPATAAPAHPVVPTLRATQQELPIAPSPVQRRRGTAVVGRSAHPAPPEWLVPRHDVNAGPAHVRGGGTIIRRPNEPLLVTLIGCLNGGLEISSRYVGCH